MSTYSETIDLSIAPVANGNCASAGYTHDILLAMVAPIAPGFYASCGRRTEDTIIGNRDNDRPAEHTMRILAAAAHLRTYGVRVRVTKHNGRPDSITVYGPKRGGSNGRYSA